MQGCRSELQSEGSEGAGGIELPRFEAKREILKHFAKTGGYSPTRAPGSDVTEMATFA